MTAEVLTFQTFDEPAPVAGVTLRRVLFFLFVALGALATLWILGHLGPVAYGVPVTFLRRGASSSL